MIADYEQRERDLTAKLRDGAKPDKAIAMRFMKAKTAMQMAVMADDPLGMAKPKLSQRTEAAVREYEAALDALEQDLGGD